MTNIWSRGPLPPLFSCFMIRLLSVIFWRSLYEHGIVLFLIYSTFYIFNREVCTFLWIHVYPPIYPVCPFWCFLLTFSGPWLYFHLLFTFVMMLMKFLFPYIMLSCSVFLSLILNLYLLPLSYASPLHYSFHSVCFPLNFRSILFLPFCYFFPHVFLDFMSFLFMGLLRILTTLFFLYITLSG